MDEDVVRHLPEFGICWVSSLEQVSEQAGHDEHVKVSGLVSCMHYHPAMNDNIVNTHTCAGTHRHSSRLAIEAMRAAN